MKRYYKSSVFGAVAFCMSAGSAQAILITQETDANLLASSILGSGVTVSSASLSGQSLLSGAVSSGTYTNASGVYGIGDGIVISSGNVSDYNDGPNSLPGNTTNFNTSASGAQETLLDPITGGSLDHYDVTQFDLVFDVDSSTDSIFFNVVFGSDEYAEFVNSSFIDAFGIYLNGVNIALFDALPVNINHPNMDFIAGTELDGILDPTSGAGNPIMLFEGAVAAGSTGNTLTFIIADSGDTALDSTAYISGFGNVDPGGGTCGGGTGNDCPTGVPEPSILALLGVGLLTLGVTTSLRRRKENV